MRTVLLNYTNTRNNNFNLIRFVAASLVVYTHSFVLVVGPGETEPLRNYIGMSWGDIAVDIFFVTSGFLITGSLFSRNNIIAFIWARILRIYPALIVVILFCVVIVGMFFTTLTPSEYISNSQTCKYLLKNITLFFGAAFQLPGVFADTPYKNTVNGSLWTLPYEVKMYAYLAIICSILTILQKRFGRNLLKHALLGITTIAISLNIFNHFHHLVSRNFLHLFSMFFTGASFYIWRDTITITRKVFFPISLILAVSTFSKEIFFIVYSISIAYLIIYSAYVPSGRIRDFNKIGDYSYGMYIYAFPVQQSIVAFFKDVSVTVMFISAFGVSLVLSFLSWHLIEKKCLRLKDKYVVFEAFFQGICLTSIFTRTKESCLRPLLRFIVRINEIMLHN